jgi:Pectate lyase superfamily protein
MPKPLNTTVADAYNGPQNNTGGMDFRAEQTVWMPGGGIFDRVNGFTMPGGFQITPSGGIAFPLGSLNGAALTNATVSLSKLTLRGWYNIIDFGAVGNGVADDTAAIQAALSAANANGGGIVIFPTGTWKTTATLNLGVNTIVLGSGRTVCNLLWTATSTPALSLASAVGATAGGIYDLIISAAAVATAPAILLAQPYDYNLERLVTTGGVPGAFNAFSAIQIGASTADTAVNIFMHDLLLTSNCNAVDWVAGNGGGLYVQNVVASGAGLAGSWGWRFAGALTNVETIMFSGGGTGNYAYGLIINPSAGFVQSGFFQHYLFDANTTFGVYLKADGASTIQRIKFAQTWINGGVIAFLAGAGGMTGTIQDLALIASNIMGGATYGFACDGGSKIIKVTACKLYENGSQAYLNGSDIIFEDNHAQGLYLPAGSGGYNVNGVLLGAALGRYVLRNNDLRVNTTPVVDGSSFVQGQIRRGNTAYNPVGSLVAPGVPASGTPLLNPFSFDVTVYVTANAIGATTITVNGTGVSMALGQTIAFPLLAQGSITATYANAPVWAWNGM